MSHTRFHAGLEYGPDCGPSCDQIRSATDARWSRHAITVTEKSEGEKEEPA